MVRSRFDSGELNKYFCRQQSTDGMLFYCQLGLGEVLRFQSSSVANRSHQTPDVRYLKIRELCNRILVPSTHKSPQYQSCLNQLTT